jgi:hypothetical protein
MMLRRAVYSAVDPCCDRRSSVIWILWWRVEVQPFVQVSL